MAIFDSQTWYQVTENRVDFNSALRANGQTVSIAKSDYDQDNEYWQFFSLLDGTYQIRNKAQGIRSQLSTCQVPAMVESTTIRPCLQPSSDSDAQKWRIVPWGQDHSLNGAFYFENVANGTGYRMDVHSSNPVFMSNDTSGKNVPAQHWKFAIIRNITDSSYFTPITEATTITSNSTAAETSSFPSGVPSSTPGLSTSARVGVATGVGLTIVVSVLLTILLLIYRRRKQVQSKGEVIHSHRGDSGDYGAPAIQELPASEIKGLRGLRITIPEPDPAFIRY